MQDNLEGIGAPIDIFQFSTLRGDGRGGSGGVGVACGGDGGGRGRIQHLVALGMRSHCCLYLSRNARAGYELHSLHHSVHDSPNRFDSCNMASPLRIKRT